MLKSNVLHINGLTYRELLWINLSTKYLTSFYIITWAFSIKTFLSTHTHAMPFTCTIICTKYINLWLMKIQSFNCCNVIFLMKIKNEISSLLIDIPARSIAWMLSNSKWGFCCVIVPWSSNHCNDQVFY